RADVANRRGTGLRAAHLSDEGGRSAGAGNLPRSGGRNRRRRQNFVGEERSIGFAAVIAPRSVEAVAVRADVDGQPAGSAGSLPLSVDLRVGDERAGKPVA